MVLALFVLVLLLLHSSQGIVWSTKNLTEAKASLAATTVQNFALFGGGYTGNSYYNSKKVDIFNINNGVWTTANLSVGRDSLAATSVGNYALFAGGFYSTSFAGVNDITVDIFDSIQNTWSTYNLSQGRSSLGATTVGNYALFAGGWLNPGQSCTVDKFDVNFFSWTVEYPLSVCRSNMAATSIRDIAIFAGGYTDDGATNAVDIFNATNGSWKTANLTQARYNLAATSVGNYAIFAGGICGINCNSNRVDILNVNTGMWTTSTLSQGRYALSAVTVGNYALFAGGRADITISNVVDVFDAVAGIWRTLTLPSQGRYSFAVTSIGDIAMLGGGYNPALLQSVDVFNATEYSSFLASSTTSIPGITTGGITTGSLFPPLSSTTGRASITTGSSSITTSNTPITTSRAPITSGSVTTGGGGTPSLFSITPLQNGVSTNEVLNPQPDLAHGYALNYYSFFIPEGATQVGISINNTNSACSSLQLLVRAGFVPCSRDYYADASHICYSTSSVNTFSYGSNVSYVFESPSTNGIHWRVNTTWYIGVGRYQRSDFNKTCTFTIKPTILKACTQSGQVSAFDTGGTVICSNYIPIPSLPYTATITQGTLYNNYFKLSNLPLDIAYILVHITGNRASYDLKGYNYGVRPFASGNACVRISNVGLDYDYKCYVVRAGDFFVQYVNLNPPYDVSLTFSYQVCGTGMGGYNCTFVSIPYNSTNRGPYHLPSMTSLNHPMFYVYFDVPPLTPRFNLTVLSTTNGGYADLCVRHLGYPEDSSLYGYDFTAEDQNLIGKASFILEKEDLYPGGRWYFAIENYSPGYYVNFTFYWQMDSLPSTTGFVTTASVTSGNDVTSGYEITSGSFTVVTTSSVQDVTSGQASVTSGISSEFATTGSPSDGDESASSPFYGSFCAFFYAIMFLFS